MQLQPFRRPNAKAAEDTRAFLLRNLPPIRDAYVHPLALHPSELTTPKPGDLHDWDKLVDGCLYFDTSDPGSRPYLFAIGGECDWVSRDGQFDNEWGSHGNAYRAQKATVIAVLDPSLHLSPSDGSKIVLPPLQLARVRSAIAEHQSARKSGGAK